MEAFTTSGGLGTMCETYAGVIENLDYKTMRYPGHMALMNFFFHELLMRENRAEAGRILTNAKPPVDEDVVYVHVAAEGWVNGALRRKEFVRAYYPLDIAGKSRTAIAWTTSASVVAVIEMVRDGKLPQSTRRRLTHVIERRGGGLKSEAALADAASIGRDPARGIDDDFSRRVDIEREVEVDRAICKRFGARESERCDRNRAVRADRRPVEREYGESIETRLEGRVTVDGVAAAGREERGGGEGKEKAKTHAAACASGWCDGSHGKHEGYRVT